MTDDQGRVTNRLYLVGAGSGTERCLTPEARETILRCRHIACGRSLLPLVEALGAGDGAFVIGSDLDAVRDFIGRNLATGDVCALTSGDPGCFSILRFLKEHFPDRIEVVPGISSVQLLAARLEQSWDDWDLMSFHGREFDMIQAPDNVTVFFCDERNTPQAVARKLLEIQGFDPSSPGSSDGAKRSDCQATVGVALGRPDELLVQGRLSEISGMVLPGHSVMVVMFSPPAVAPEPPPMGATAPGIPDELWLRREGIPLSKSEVRAVLLAKAQPAGRRVIWDVGAGTGSYGIECSLLEPRSQVISIDKNPDACHLVAENAERFGARVEVIMAEAPEGFETLAPPDLVIIGGNEGMLVPIFKAAQQALNPGGRMLVTALLEETKRTAHKLFAESGLGNRAATRVSIARGHAHDWAEQNPVIIFTGERL